LIDASTTFERMSLKVGKKINYLLKSIADFAIYDDHIKQNRSYEWDDYPPLITSIIL